MMRERRGRKKERDEREVRDRGGKEKRERESRLSAITSWSIHKNVHALYICTYIVIPKIAATSLSSLFHVVLD